MSKNSCNKFTWKTQNRWKNYHDSRETLLKKNYFKDKQFQIFIDNFLKFWKPPLNFFINKTIF